MTNSPPPDPRSSRLGFDELIGIVIAFGVIGTIFFWSLSRGDNGNVTGVPDPSRTDQLSPSTPEARTTPTPTPDVITADPSPQPTVTAAPREYLPPTPRTPVPQAASDDLTYGSVPVPVPLPAERVSPSPATPAEPANVVPVPAPSPAAEAVNFSDVPQDYWARPYIEAMAQRDIVAGFTDGTFRPEQPITRAEFAVMVQKAFQQNSNQKPANFKDVPADFWAVSAIQGSSNTGFLRGYPGQIFRPTQQIPRAQVFVSLANGLKLTPSAESTQVLQTYQDATRIPQYARNAVAAATNAGLVVNYPNPKELRPQQAGTRAEVAAAIYQALVQAGKAEKIPSQYLVQQQ